jgi:hypothetical protein
MKPANDPAILIHFEDGHMEPYDIHDMVLRIAQDLPRSRCLFQPGILEQAVECLIRHFCQVTKHKRVSLAEFIGTAREMLESFARENGEDEFTECQIDLLSAVHQPGFGFELEFFNHLRRFLGTVGGKSCPSSSATHVIEVRGLSGCVKYLAGHRHWSRRCHHLRDEIITFIRKELARRGGNSPILAIVD